MVVSCDQCDREVEWGLEGNMAGAAGRSRFCQWRVICSTCTADRLYAEIGAWLVVALAAHSAEDPNMRSNIAQAPVTTLLDTLLGVGRTVITQDLLVTILGEEAQDPEVRRQVLRKARVHVPNILGDKPVVKEDPEEAEAAAEEAEAGDEAEHAHGDAQPAARAKEVPAVPAAATDATPPAPAPRKRSSGGGDGGGSGSASSPAKKPKVAAAPSSPAKKRKAAAATSPAKSSSKRPVAAVTAPPPVRKGSGRGGGGAAAGGGGRGSAGGSGMPRAKSKKSTK